MKHHIKFGLVPGGDSVLHPIRVRVTWAGRRADIRLGISVEPARWDKNKGRMQANTRTANGDTAFVVNRRLGAVEEALEELFGRFELIHHREPTSDEVRACVEALIKKKSSPVSGRLEEGGEPSPQGSVFAVLDDFVTQQSKAREWTHASFEKYSVLRMHLERFDTGLDIGDVCEASLQGFVDSLHREGLRNTTIAKTLDNFRTFLRWCNKRGLLENSDYASFRPRLRGGDGSLKEVIYLDWDELMQLYQFSFPPNHRGLEAVRDVFCFQCFTGLRYSDVAKLRWVDINWEAGYFLVVTQKTVDALRIELNKFSRAILEKYRRPDYNGVALPVISNVKMNVYLKTLGQMVGIAAPQRIVYFKGAKRYEEVYPKYELLTTHCGRRTFVVNALSLGIPAEVIMKWTGHKDFKAMRPYVKIVDSLKSAEMRRFDNAFDAVSASDPKSDPEIGKIKEPPNASQLP